VTKSLSETKKMKFQKNSKNQPRNNKSNSKKIPSDARLITTSPHQPITTPPSLSYVFHNPNGPRRLIFVIVLFVFLQIFDVWTDFYGSMNVEEFTSNSSIIEAQRRAKSAKKKGDLPKSPIDEIMMNTPTIKAQKDYLIKTPEGNYAYYFENEQSEPFLIDNAGNIWMWEGIDPNNPTDDWLVRNTEGEIYNYSIDVDGKLHQKFVGNEKDLKAIPQSNLGTIIGFKSEEINDLHYLEIPRHSLEPFVEEKTNDIKYLAPSLLEEGFMEFRKKDKPTSRIPSYEVLEGIKKEEISNKSKTVDEKPPKKFDTLMSITGKEENEAITALLKERRISPDEARMLRLDLHNEIKEEILSSVGGLDVKNLENATNIIDQF